MVAGPRYTLRARLRGSHGPSCVTAAHCEIKRVLSSRMIGAMTVTDAIMLPVICLLIRACIRLRRVRVGPTAILFRYCVAVPIKVLGQAVLCSCLPVAHGSIAPGMPAPVVGVSQMLIAVALVTF